MKHNITRRKALASLASTALVLPGLTLAQADRPVKFILPNATGSGVDAITRAAAPALGKALGANVVVENQAGASGVIGLQAMAKNPPDGLTLSVVSNNVVIFPSVIKNLPFEMPGDFTPIAVLGATPLVLVEAEQQLIRVVVAAGIGVVGVLRRHHNLIDLLQAATPVAVADRVTQALKLHLFSTLKE